MSGSSSEKTIVVRQDRLTGQLTGVEIEPSTAASSGEVRLPAAGAPVQVRVEDADPASLDPAFSRVRPFLLELEGVLEQRKESGAERSYTRSLFDAGPAKIGEKLREEAGELARAVADESQDRVASEAADLVYHMLVGLRFREVSLREVISKLAARFGTSGHVEKASRRPGQ